MCLLWPRAKKGGLSPAPCFWWWRSSFFPMTCGFTAVTESCMAWLRVPLWAPRHLVAAASFLGYGWLPVGCGWKPAGCCWGWAVPTGPCHQVAGVAQPSCPGDGRWHRAGPLVLPRPSGLRGKGQGTRSPGAFVTHRRGGASLRVHQPWGFSPICQGSQGGRNSPGGPAACLSFPVWPGAAFLSPSCVSQPAALQSALLWALRGRSCFPACALVDQ